MSVFVPKATNVGLQRHRGLVISVSAQAIGRLDKKPAAMLTQRFVAFGNDRGPAFPARGLPVIVGAQTETDGASYAATITRH